MIDLVLVCPAADRREAFPIVSQILQLVCSFSTILISENADLQIYSAFYHPFTEAISSIITELPSKVIIAILFNLTIYFMTNLRREVGAFFTFFLFSFTMTLTMSNIFRTVASLSRTLSQAMVPASTSILAMTIYAGFAIPTNDMRVWFRWINYINPIAYAFESLMINEFQNRRFDCTSFVPVGPSYTSVSSFERVCTAVGSVPGQNYVDGNVYLKKSFNYEPAHLWR